LLKVGGILAYRGFQRSAAQTTGMSSIFIPQKLSDFHAYNIIGLIEKATLASEAMAIEKQLHKLCTAAGGQQETAPLRCFVLLVGIAFCC